MSGSNSALYSAVRAVAVTKSDATVLPTTRGLWVGGAGDVAVRFTGDTAAVTLVGVLAGSLLPIEVVQVMSTNTTATSMLALY